MKQSKFYTSAYPIIHSKSRFKLYTYTYTQTQNEELKEKSKRRLKKDYLVYIGWQYKKIETTFLFSPFFL